MVKGFKQEERWPSGVLKPTGAKWIPMGPQRPVKSKAEPEDPPEENVQKNEDGRSREPCGDTSTLRSQQCTAEAHKKVSTRTWDLPIA